MLNSPDGPGFAAARESLTLPDHFPLPPGTSRLPPRFLVEAEATYREKMRPLMPTGRAVYDLLTGIKTPTLQRGDLTVRPESEVPRIDFTDDELFMLEKAGISRVKRIKDIVDDLKAEGIERTIPPGIDKEAALITFATLYERKQQFAQLLSTKSEQERTALLQDLQTWQQLMERVHTSSDHEYGLLPRVSKQEDVVLERYFKEGGRDICQTIYTIQQLEDRSAKSGMPQLPDSELDKINPWTSVHLYNPAQPVQ